MDRRAAAELLGVDPDSSPQLVRARYRSLLLQSHPDRNQRSDAAERTMRLTTAYRVLRIGEPPRTTAPTDPPRAATDPPERAAPGAERRAPAAPGDPSLLGPTTIGLELPATVALGRLLDISLDLGEVTYLDRSSGLLEVVVEFVDAPTSSVVLTVVGHSEGSRVDCWVEPLSGGSAPAADAVTRLVLRTLCGENPAG